MIGGAFVIFFGLVSDPHHVGITVDGEEAPAKSEDRFEALVPILCCQEKNWKKIF